MSHGAVVRLASRRSAVAHAPKKCRSRRGAVRAAIADSGLSCRRGRRRRDRPRGAAQSSPRPSWPSRCDRPSPLPLPLAAGCAAGARAAGEPAAGAWAGAGAALRCQPSRPRSPWSPRLPWSLLCARAGVAACAWTCAGACTGAGAGAAGRLLPPPRSPWSASPLLSPSPWLLPLPWLRPELYSPPPRRPERPSFPSLWRAAGAAGVDALRLSPLLDGAELRLRSPWSLLPWSLLSPRERDGRRLTEAAERSLEAGVDADWRVGESLCVVVVVVVAAEAG